MRPTAAFGYGHKFIGTIPINGEPHTYEYSHTQRQALDGFKESTVIERENLPENLKAYVDCREVSAGTELGLIGNTGNSFGDHLHAEIKDAQGNRINPEEHLKLLTELHTIEDLLVTKSAEETQTDSEENTES